jgi:hypothetical protein
MKKSIRKKNPLIQRLKSMGYMWCRKKYHGIFWGAGGLVGGCGGCQREAERTQKGECNAQLHHGPGHQSHTYCQLKGPHKIHLANVGFEVAQWKTKHVFSGYFDEMPTID